MEVAQRRFSVNIFSPRWGHDDQWTFSWRENGFEVTGGPHHAVVVYEVDDSGGCKETALFERHPLITMFHNDSINVPDCTFFMLRYLWVQLKNGEDVRLAQSALDDLAHWINATTRSRPKTGYWDGVV
ncbi:MAG: hypothetical protein V1790_04720 [Planctomycetota bacterium]